MVHFFFLSPGMASNILCSRAAITGKAGLLLECGSQHSSIRCFTSSGTTLPNLQMQGVSSKLDQYLSDICRERSAMVASAGVLLGCKSRHSSPPDALPPPAPRCHTCNALHNLSNLRYRQSAPMLTSSMQIPSGTASPRLSFPIRVSAILNHSCMISLAANQGTWAPAMKHSSGREKKCALHRVMLHGGMLMFLLISTHAMQAPNHAHLLGFRAWAEVNTLFADKSMMRNHKTTMLTC